MNYRNKQQGVVLAIALIALVAISLAGVALMRTVDTGNVVSGNIAFNEAAIQIADIGAELAYAQINANLYYQHNSDGSLTGLYNDPLNPGNITGYQLNSTGCESMGNWSQASCPAYYYLTLQSSPQTWYSVPSTQVSPALPTGYSLQYAIERMCTATGVATFANCNAVPVYTAGILQPDPLVDSTGTTLIDANNKSVLVGKLFYRVTVKVTGPKNTTAQSVYFYGIQDYI